MNVKNLSGENLDIVLEYHCSRLFTTCILVEEIAFEIDHFQTSVTLTLTLDRVIRHTVVCHLSTAPYIKNFLSELWSWSGVEQEAKLSLG